MTLVDDVIAMTNVNRALSSEERDQLLKVVPKMGEEDLKKTQNLLLELGKAHLRTKEQEVSMLEYLHQHMQKLEGMKRREDENKKHAEDEAQAEKLISDL